MSSVKIEYANVAVGAKESFQVSATDKTEFVDLSEFNVYNANFKNFLNPFDYYSVTLDGEALPIPSNITNENFGLWSEQLSDSNDGRFDNPIVVDIVSQETFSSEGLTLKFDEYNNVYATNINIAWYKDNTFIKTVDFNPTSAIYHCDETVQDYNRIIILFYAINMPENRLKLHSIDYGYGTIWFSQSLRTVNLTQEINPISSEIPISTCNVTIDSANLYNKIQVGQPIKTYYDDDLVSTAFITDIQRTSETIYQIKSEDYIGYMDKSVFVGGIYKNKNAKELLREIFEAAKVPYDIPAVSDEATVSGHLPYTTCREALLQVLFATGYFADTSYSESVIIKKASDNISQSIGLNRIMQGQRAEEKPIVTEVQITAYNYVKSGKIVELYNSNGEAPVSQKLIIFDKPVYGLEISGGTISEPHENYAIIDISSSDCILTGKEYAQQSTIYSRKNDSVRSNVPPNVVSINNATLISYDNVDNVLNSCYNYLASQITVRSQIIESKHKNKDGDVIYDLPIKLGDRVEIDTLFYGQKSGIATKQTFSLTGGIIIKDTIIK